MQETKEKQTKRNNKGITLVSLIVTIIVLLILAGIALSAILGDNGLIEKAAYSKIVSDANNKKEAIEVLIWNMKLEKIGQKITIEEIVDKIIEEGLADEEDIVIGEDGKTITIIEEDYIVKIEEKEDENGNKQEHEVTIEIAEGIGEGVTQISYRTEPEAGVKGETVDIIITAENAKEDITKIVYPDGQEKTYGDGTRKIEERYTVIVNGNYTFEVTSESGRKVSKTVEVRNVEISGSNISIGYIPTQPTNEEVRITISGAEEGYTLEYQTVEIGESPQGDKWVEYSGEITTDKNITIYARQKDNMGVVGEHATANVANIDKEQPNEFTMQVTATTNSITVSGSTTDVGSTGTAASNIGISGYQFKLDSESWTAKQTSGTYTFSGLTQGTSHTVQMKAIDKAGNERLATMSTGGSGTTGGGTETGGITTGEVTDSSETGTINISYSPTTATNQNVQVTITSNNTNSGLTLKYQVGSTTGTWTTYSSPVTMSSNGAIYARLEDSTGQANGYVTANVANIDKEQPNEFTMQLTSTTNSITVTGSTTDVGSVGTAASNIGISGYQFKLDSESWTAKQTSGTYTFSGLTQGTSHTVQMKAIDLAGNERLATMSTGGSGTTGGGTETGGITTGEVTDSSEAGAINISYSPTTATNQNVQVTITSNNTNSGLTLKYQVGSTTGTWTTYSNPVTMSSNGAIYARLEDSTGQANGYATANVANIDKEQPNEFTMQVTATTNSITVSGSTTDVGSVGTAVSNIGISGYQFKLDSGSWTAKQTSGTYTFSGLTQGTSHTVQMKAIDLAGNERLATMSTGGSGTTGGGTETGGITVGKVTDSSTAGVIGISYSPTAATKGNVQVTITNNSGNSGLTLKYQIGSTTGTWTTYSNPVTMSSNGAIYARLEDSTGQANGYATGNIANIDKEKPKAFTMQLTATTNSITVSGSTTDVGSVGTAVSNIGISGYQFKLDSGSWTAKQASGTYTFSGLTQGTSHTVQMKAIDLAGNERLATMSTGGSGTTGGGTETGGITVGKVTDSSTAGVIGISYSPTAATKGNVQVTITNNSGNSGLTLKYQIGSTTGTWTTYSNPVTMSNNGAIYARLEDSTGQANGYATGNIANIDKQVPVISTATASTSWGTSNSVTVKATDSGSSGTAASNIGIIGYGINKSSTTAPTFTSCTATTTLNQTITGITANGTYYVWVKDRAGNTANKAVTVNRVDTAAPTTATIASSNITTNSFTLTATGADSQSGVASYKFYVGGSLYSTQNTTAGTCSINVTGRASGTNYSCYVIVTDKAGRTKQSSTINVETIKSYVGYYADIDGDKEPDGIIYADLLIGGAGGYHDATYTIPVIDDVKEYHVSKQNHVGVFGTRDVITATNSTGNDRFYVMALEDVDEDLHCWYNEAYYVFMNDYATATSSKFGTGKTNTATMISKWNSGAYGAKDTGSYTDVWGIIQTQFANGWFVPSREEWAAFSDTLEIEEVKYGLKDAYWSSSQYWKTEVWKIDFESFKYSSGISMEYVLYRAYVRLSTTF